MRSGWPTAISGGPGIVSWGSVTRSGAVIMHLVVNTIAKGAYRPRRIILWKVDPTIVPGVSISVKASGRFYRDERRLGDVGRALEKGCVDGLGAVLSAV